MNIRKGKIYTELDYKFMHDTIDISSISFHRLLATCYKNDDSAKSQTKIDNPYNLSPAQLESNRISKLQLDEAIRLKKLGNDSK
jgi:hypothetical protein